MDKRKFFYTIKKSEFFLGKARIVVTLVLYNPKKSSHAEDVIYGIIQSLINANKSIILNKIKFDFSIQECQTLYIF